MFFIFQIITKYIFVLFYLSSFFFFEETATYTIPATAITITMIKGIRTFITLSPVSGVVIDVSLPAGVSVPLSAASVYLRKLPKLIEPSSFL